MVRNEQYTFKAPTTVAEEPEPGLAFTWRRCSSHQFEADKTYFLVSGSDEEKHFLSETVKLVKEAAKKDAAAPVHAFLQAAQVAVATAIDNPESLADTLDIQMIKFGQLEKLGEKASAKLPAIDMEQYLDRYTEHPKAAGHVINPEGTIYKKLGKQVWPGKFSLTAEIKLPDFKMNLQGQATERDIRYAVRLECIWLSKEQRVESGASQGTVLTTGEFNQSTFLPWGSVLCVCTDIAKCQLWPIHPPDPGVDDDPDADFVPKASAKYSLDNIDGCLSVYVTSKNGEGEWKRLCAFAITSVLAIYTHTEADKNPIFRIECSRILDDGKETVVRTTPEKPREVNPAIHGRLEAEILVPVAELKDNSQLRKCFLSFSHYLLCEGLLLEHFNTWLNQLMPWPTATRVVTYFGRQEKSDLFVFGNCCFENGRVKSLTDANLGVMASTFTTGKMTLLPWPQDNWPRLIWIPQTWIRYAFFAHVWNKIFPEMFHNNTVAAYSAFSLAVMHMHAIKFWDGHGACPGVTCGYLKSTAPYTGKSFVQQFINAMLGLQRRGLMIGAFGDRYGTTNPSLAARLCMQSGMSLQIDEIVTEQSLAADKGEMVKNSAHGLFDHTFRGVLATAGSMGEQRPKSAWIGSANYLPKETKDKACLQRMLIIHFLPIKGAPSKDTDYVKNQRWQAVKSLSSCIFADLESLRHNGNLDAAAINDCHSVIEITCGAMYSRNGQQWGNNLFYMLTMDFIAGQNNTDMIMSWVCDESAKQTQIATKYTTDIEQFLISLQDALRISSPITGEATKCIHWHNYRTTEKPGDFAVPYVALLLDSCVAAVNHIMKTRYSCQNVLASALQTDWCLVDKAPKCNFYDLKKGPWPIAINEHSDDPYAPVQLVPRQEADLEAKTFTKLPAVWIVKAKFDEIETDVQSVKGMEVDYKSVVITSANKRYNGGMPYNFYDAVKNNLNEIWFGYRSCAQSTFANYCFYNKVAQDERGVVVVNPMMKDLMAQNGYTEHVLKYFEPDFILQYFQGPDGQPLDKPPDPASLPPCFRINPFVFQNEDRELTRIMPDDEISEKFYAYQSDEFDKMPAPSPSKRRHGAMAMGDCFSPRDSNAGGSSPLGSSSKENTPGGVMNRSDAYSHSFRAIDNAFGKTRRLTSEDEQGEDLMDSDEEEVSSTPEHISDLFRARGI
jgi:hypothetical protein